MGLLNLIKREKRAFLLVLVIAFFALLLLLPKPDRYDYKSEEAHFTVNVPKGWTVVAHPRQPGGTDVEASPDEGIELLLGGNGKYTLRIYTQYGPISLPEGIYDKEDFRTTQGIKGTLYKEREEKTIFWHLILEQNIAPGFYGAVVRFKDESLLGQHQEEIMQTLKSIRIFKPQRMP